jgi:hypothetical protein
VKKLLNANRSVFLVGIRQQPLTLVRHHLPEGQRSLYVLDSMATLHEAVSRAKDVPATPHLRWVSNTGTSASPLFTRSVSIDTIVERLGGLKEDEVASNSGRPQVQGGMGAMI